MATTTTTSQGGRLREDREAAGLTRAQLAGLAGCSLASLANIEQGAVPKHSRVLDAARSVLEGLQRRDCPAEAAQGARENSARQGRHGAG